MAAESAVEAGKREKVRADFRKHKARLAKQKAIKQRIQNEAAARKLAKAKEKEARQASEEAVQAAKALMEREFTIDELRPQKQAGSKARSRQARADFLERLRLAHGVSEAAQTYWHDFREW